jgi:hypothetical protein
VELVVDAPRAPAEVSAPILEARVRELRGDLA